MELRSSIRRGVLAGLVGTAAMTAFQKFVEMPITGRGESDAPARFAERVLPVSPTDDHARRRLNWVTHFALGGMWGTAFGIAGHAGVRGQRAVNMVFPVVYIGDILLNTALGLYKPRGWSTKEFVVDVVDKYVQAQATGGVFDRMEDS